MTQENTTQYTVEDVAKILRLISHPFRLSILNFIIHNNNGVYVYEIMEHTKIAQSIVSQYLTKLRAMSIVKDTREGTCIRYTVEDDFIKELIALVSRYTEL